MSCSNKTNAFTAWKHHTVQYGNILDTVTGYIYAVTAKMQFAHCLCSIAIE